MAVSQSLAVTQSSQSVSGNTSKVRIVWKTTQTGESYNGYTKTAYYYVSINGGAETRYSVSYTLPKGSTKTLVDTTLTVSHKADGKGTIKVRTWMNTGISAGTIEQTKTLTLDTIPRATTPTVSASSVAMGGKVTINLPRAASGFTHDLAYKFGSDTSYTAITTGAGTSYSWTVPDLAAKIPKATSGTVTIRCITKSGGTTIGTKTCTLTATVPSSVIPTVSTVTVTEAVAGLAEQFNAFIQNKSKLSVIVTGTGAKGSSITAYQVTALGKTYTSASFTTDTVTTSGGITIKARVKDSRGRWSEYYTLLVPISAYAKPKIPTLEAYRCNASGEPDTEGTFLAVRYQYSASSLGGTNTIEAKLEYKLQTDDEYTELLTNTAASANTTYKPKTPTFSIDYPYNIRLTVTDWFGATDPSVTVLPSGEVIVDVGADGKSIGVGTTATLPGVNLGWDIVGALRSMGSQSGQYRTHDGLLIQWGSASITPEAVDTPTTVVVTFPHPYAETPATVATPVTGVPHTVSVGVQRATTLVDPKKAVAITLTRSGLTSTGVNWVAIGRGADE